MHPYEECKTCIATKWCKIYSGEVKVQRTTEWCHAKFYLDKALGLSNIPPEYADANIYNFEVDEDNGDVYHFLKEAVSSIVDLVDAGSNFILFGNRPGTGKTYAASVLVNHFIYKTCLTRFDFEHPLALFVVYPDMIDTLRYNRGDIEEFIKAVKDVPLLLLDDVGAGTHTEYSIEQTYIILNHRFSHRKSTIITTNLSVSDLSKPTVLGERIVSRILARAQVIEVGGRDRRIGL